jgi:hypothetical protein
LLGVKQALLELGDINEPTDGKSASNSATLTK